MTEIWSGSRGVGEGEGEISPSIYLAWVFIFLY